MKIEVKALLVAALLFLLVLSPPSAHAADENMLSAAVNYAKGVIDVIIVIARQHENDLNKERMLPLVGQLQDKAEFLQTSNRVLKNSITRAYANTKRNEKVPDAFAEQVVKNAIQVNKDNAELLKSLREVQTYLRSLQLKDDSGRALDATTRNGGSLIGIVEKQEIIRSIKDSFELGRSPVTQETKASVNTNMGKAIAKIDAVVTQTRTIYDALNR